VGVERCDQCDRERPVRWCGGCESYACGGCFPTLAEGIGVVPVALDRCRSCRSPTRCGDLIGDTYETCVLNSWHWGECSGG